MKYCLISKIYSYSNLMSNFIAKIFLAEYLLNFKVSEFEHELEPGDLGGHVCVRMWSVRQHFPKTFTQLLKKYHPNQ